MPNPPDVAKFVVALLQPVFHREAVYAIILSDESFTRLRVRGDHSYLMTSWVTACCEVHPSPVKSLYSWQRLRAVQCSRFLARKTLLLRGRAHRTVENEFILLTI